MPSVVVASNHIVHSVGLGQEESTAPSNVASKFQEMEEASATHHASGGRAHPTHAQWVKGPASVVAMAKLGFRFEEGIVSRLKLDVE